MGQFHKFPQADWSMAQQKASDNGRTVGMAERLELMNRRLEGLGLDPLDDLGRDG